MTEENPQIKERKETLGDAKKRAFVEEIFLEAATDEEADLIFRTFLTEGVLQEDDRSSFQEKRAVLAKAEEENRPAPETQEAREIALSDTILELFYKDNPLQELVERAFSGAVDPSTYRELANLLARLEGVVDLNLRFQELDKLDKDGLLSPETSRAAALAFLKDNTKMLQFLASFVERKFTALRAEHGAKIPHEALAQVQQKLYVGFVGEAGKVRVRYQEKRLGELHQQYGDQIPYELLLEAKQAKNIPEFEVREIRDAVDALPRQLKLSLQSQIGALAFEEIEGVKGRGFGYDEIVAHLRIPFDDGEDLADRLFAAREVYRKLYEEMKKTREEKSIITSRPGGRPLFTRTNIDALDRVARRWLSRNPDLPADEREELVRHMRVLEEFLLKHGDLEIKERVKGAQERELDRAKLHRGAKHVIDVNKEIASGGFATIIEGLNRHIEEVDVELKGVLAELQEINPLYAKGKIRRLLSLNTLKLLLIRERQELHSEDQKQGVGQGVEVDASSPGNFNQKLELIVEQTVREIASAPTTLLKKELQDFCDRVRILQDTEKNYFDRLVEAAIGGLVTADEYHAYFGYIEASAQATEIKEKEMQAYLDGLDDLDKSSLTAKDTEKLGKNRSRALSDLVKLRNRAANLRRGSTKGVIE